MDYLRILTGKQEPLPLYKDVIACLVDQQEFPDLLEPIYRDAMKLDDESLDRFRFALLRLRAVCRHSPERGSGKSDADQICGTGP